MDIGINHFNASADHKPLHVFRIQQQVVYAFYITLHGYSGVYVSQFYFNATNKVARYII